jgi:hypothetical protein
MRPTRNARKPGAGRCQVFTLLLLLLLPSGVAVAGELADADGALAWKFQPGQTLRYRLRHSVVTTVVTGAGNEQSEAPLLDATLAWFVEKVDAQGTAEIRQTLVQVREEMNERSPGGARVVYDSTDPKTVDNQWSRLMDALYRPLIGAPYRLKVDRLGHISEITISEDALKGWREVSLQPQNDRDYLFTQDGLRFLLSAVPELPGRPVAQEEGWRYRRERTEVGVRATSVETFSLTGSDGPSATFEAKPEIAVEVAPKPARHGAEPVPSKQVAALVGAEVEKQSGASKLTFDLVAGRMVAYSRRQRSEVKYAYEKAGTRPARTIKVTTAIEFDMKLMASAGGR